MLPLLSLVRLTTDRYADRGVGAGAIGTVVLVYDDAYEVEFSRPDGTTIAWFTVRPDELERVEEVVDTGRSRRAG